MKISELLKQENILIDLEAQSKEKCIEIMAQRLFESGFIKNKNEFVKDIKKREELGTTAMGEGVAIPHAKSKEVKSAAICAAVLKNGIDWGAFDGKSRLIFMIAAPQNGADEHLNALAALSTMLMKKEVRQALLKSKTAEEFLYITEKNQEQREEKEEGYYDIVAVTACPTGIAHTYMAAEGLAQAAEKKGVKIKVETNGSGGVKNKLTAEEIKNAKAVIIAADRKVETDRFNGKRVINVRVSEGIHRAEGLIEDALNGKGEIFKAEKTGENMKNASSKAGGAYANLMNGVSHMLPFVIGGGILIAIAFLFDNYEIDPSNFGSNTPVAAFFKRTGDAAFGFMLPVLAGYIAMSIGDKPALVSGFVGGYLANTGGSGFLGALLAGFAAGYGMLFIKKLLTFLPESLEGIKSVLLYPLLGVLLIGFLIQIVLNPPVKIINDFMFGALTGMGGVSRVLLGAVLGGMMAVDMGGPVNKAAYVFGTASIAEGNYEIMAAVMIGGMVPPIAIALCGTFFKNRFSEKEQKSSAVNYVMGLSFITEGAIPFAAADPARVIPACAIGSAVAGGLSMFFGCSLRAPHGGIFVLPIMEGRMMYIVSLVIGSVVGMILLALFKRKAENKNG